MTFAAKIASLSSLDELNGFVWGLKRQCLKLPPEEQAALARRRIELIEQGNRR